MEPNERYVGFEAGRYVLVGQRGMGTYILTAGDVIELFIQGRYQPVRVASGGYRGWYYITADGQRARLAISMQARLLPASKKADVNQILPTS
jgi:hypothetical protein